MSISTSQFHRADPPAGHFVCVKRRAWWTEEEKRIVRDAAAAGEPTSITVLKLPGRSISAIYNARNTFGVCTPQRQLALFLDPFIRENHAAEAMDGEIATAWNAQRGAEHGTVCRTVHSRVSAPLGAVRERDAGNGQLVRMVKVRADGPTGTRWIWDESKPILCVVMLNPSKADASKNDPTILRVIDFAGLAGFGGIEVVNLFALRATNPRELLTHYPIDRQLVAENDQAIRAAAMGRVVLTAWGCHLAIGARDVEVMEILKDCDVRCLGVTQDGFPRHPLYLASNTQMVPYVGRRAVRA